MYPSLISLAVVAYTCAMGLALAYLVQRHDLVHRLAVLFTLAGWAAHSVTLIVRAVERGAPPLGSLAEALWVGVWVVVVLELLLEHRTGVRVLGAFVLPIVVLLSLKATTGRPAASLAPALASAWIWIHIALAVIGIAAFVFNFVGGIMYLLQERQLKAKRPGAFYYRLPSLATLDRLTFRTLALGFPFLTVGLILGALWARTAWGSAFAFTFDPLAFFSLVAWVIYAGMLAGRAAGGWHGRRAAYFAIAGFAALVLTLGAGLFLPGRHGS
jgi:cytochrome c-type biogenesis protein CcsB